MKTGLRFWALFKATLLCSLLLGCSKDSDDASPLPTKQQLHGSWRIIDIPISPAITFTGGKRYESLLEAWKQEASSSCLNETRYVFTDNNLINLTYPGECQVQLKNIYNWKQAGFTLSGRNLLLKMSNGGEQQYSVEITGNQMKWGGRMESDDAPDNIKHEFTIILQQ